MATLCLVSKKVPVCTGQMHSSSSRVFPQWAHNQWCIVLLTNWYVSPVAQFPCANCFFSCSGKQLIIQVHFLRLLIDVAGGKKNSIMPCCMEIVIFCSTANPCMVKAFANVPTLLSSDVALINENPLITWWNFVSFRGEYVCQQVYFHVMLVALASSRVIYTGYLSKFNLCSLNW